MIATALSLLGVNQAVARIVEFLAVAVIAAALAIWIMHLRERSAAYGVLLEQHRALEAKYGCVKRPPNERDLAACLSAREAEAARAAQAEIQRQRDEAAKAQADLDAAAAKAADDTRATDDFIDHAAVTEDGAVPKVLLDTWARARKARGAQ